jgi:toxin-antitoxin system PIN domain toxin
VLSIDTNIFLYSLNEDCDEFGAASRFIDGVADQELVICELVLMELYLLLRNPAVVPAPCSSSEATAMCQSYRSNPRWRLVENAPVMDEVWARACAPAFPRRRIIDARLAATLRHHGVTRFATRNVKDFEAFDFDAVYCPI